MCGAVKATLLSAQDQAINGSVARANILPKERSIPSCCRCQGNAYAPGQHI